MSSDPLPDLYGRAFFEAQRAGSRSSALVVLTEAFARLGIPARVVDVGCGVGTWLRAARELGATEVRGIDGEWVPRDALEVPPALVAALDLDTADADALRRAAAGGKRPFDLVLSLETAEHLRPDASGRFVEGLCALGDAVLFSAAVPHQGGHGHVNERWPGFWAALFAVHGFACFDLLRPAVWLHPEVEWWYAQNALLFARGAAAERLRAHGGPVAEPLPLIHPRRFALSVAAEAGLRDELARAGA